MVVMIPDWAIPAGAPTFTKLFIQARSATTTTPTNFAATYSPTPSSGSNITGEADPANHGLGVGFVSGPSRFLVLGKKTSAPALALYHFESPKTTIYPRTTP